MNSFKIFRIHETDGKTRAGFEQARLEDLDAGEVVVKVAYSSVNYKDALAATGAGKVIRRFPCVGGIDLSGTVVESSDARFAKGDAVIATSFDLGVSHDGGYAEYVCVPARNCVPLPAELYCSESGRFFASAISSLTFFAGTDGCTSITLGRLTRLVIGVKSRIRSYGSCV